MPTFQQFLKIQEQKKNIKLEVLNERKSAIKRYVQKVGTMKPKKPNSAVGK